MWNTGLDYHPTTSNLHILNADGVRVKSQTIRGRWPLVVEAMRVAAKEAAAVGERLAVCFEASCDYGHLFEALSKVAAKVVVAHPGQLRLIYKSKRKNDGVDAAKLALLLMNNGVPEVWVPGQDARAWRRMIEYRRRTVDKRTACKNQLRALLRTHGIAAPGRQTLWSIKRRAWLKSAALPTAGDVMQRDMLIEELEHQERQVKRVTVELNRLASAHPGATLLQTIPGVGPRTAEAMAAYIDQPGRFRNGKCIGAYLGLVPCQDASGGHNRLGHITRQGPSTVRKMLIEAAWQGIRRSETIKAFYERIVGGKPDRKKIALVATAHRLARVMLSMLRHGEAWRHDGAEAKTTGEATTTASSATTTPAEATAPAATPHATSTSTPKQSQSPASSKKSTPASLSTRTSAPSSATVEAPSSSTVQKQSPASSKSVRKSKPPRKAIATTSSPVKPTAGKTGASGPAPDPAPPEGALAKARRRQPGAGG